MKIAVSGKGGVGKSTISAALALLLRRRGARVLCLDADPDANFSAALGVGREEGRNIIPISKQLDLIEERTGMKSGTYGGMFKLNPEVSDVAEKFATHTHDVDLLVLGAIQGGGSGCACAASTFIRSLVTDLVLHKNETLIMDMEAGVEHLGRATAGGVDVMLVVVEPGLRSIECARSVLRMAQEIGIRRVMIVGNKITSDADEVYIRSELANVTLAACLPFDERVRQADRDGVSVLDALSDDLTQRLECLIDMLEGTV